MKMNNPVVAFALPVSLVLFACGGSSHAKPTATPQTAADRSAAEANAATAASRSTAAAIGEPTAIAETTSLARTVVAGGPTAIAQATSAAATSAAIASPSAAPTGSVVATLVPNPPKTATAVAATVIAGGPTAIAQATAAAGQPPTATPVPRLQVTLGGPTTVGPGSSIDLEVRVDGPATSVAAFNFDIVYDQRLVTLAAPEAALEAINTSARQFQCNLPAPSGDVDADANVGRARLVCFSYGGPEAVAPQAPITIAHITLHAVAAGTATLSFENLALFTPDAKGVSVGSSPTQITIT